MKNLYIALTLFWAPFLYAADQQFDSSSPVAQVSHWVSFADLRQYGNLTVQELDQLKTLEKEATESVARDQEIVRLQLEKDNRTLTAITKEKGSNDTDAKMMFVSQFQILDNLQIVKIATRPLSEISFTAQEALMQLKLVIKSTDDSITLLYPTSGPSLDFGLSPRSKGRTILVTPAITGTLEKKTALKARVDPVYYRGKPWVRIIPDGQNWSKFGIHISPFPYPGFPSPNLERGFVSAGCIRINEADLYLLYNLVTKGKPIDHVDEKGVHHLGIPLVVDYTVPETEEHPYPIITDHYQKMSHWNTTNGKFNTEIVHGKAPIEQVLKIHEYWDF